MFVCIGLYIYVYYTGTHTHTHKHNIYMRVYACIGICMCIWSIDLPVKYTVFCGWIKKYYDGTI